MTQNEWENKKMPLLDANKISVVTESEAQTEQVGQRIAQMLEPGTVISLCGTLGAGKTRLVKGIATGLHADADLVVSPTFSIINHYLGDMRINHLDVYRVADTDEFDELGGDELFESDAITLVEWGDRFPESLPENYLQIEIEVLTDTRRRLVFRLVGDFPATFADRLRETLQRFRLR